MVEISKFHPTGNPSDDSDAFGIAPEISRTGSCHWGLWNIVDSICFRAAVFGNSEFPVQPAYRSICPGCSPVEDNALGEKFGGIAR